MLAGGGTGQGASVRRGVVAALPLNEGQEAKPEEAKAEGEEHRHPEGMARRGRGDAGDVFHAAIKAIESFPAR